MRKLYFLMLSLVVAVAANAADWYLIGANYGNWNQAEAYKFTPEASDANIQTLHVETLSGEFKIKESTTWSTSFSTNGSKLVEGVVYKCGTDGGNIVVDGTISDATLTIDLVARTLTVTGASEENEYDAVYLVGDFGSGWSETITSYPLTLKEGTEDTWVGTYKLTASANYFKMKAGTLVYGTGGQDISVVLGEQYTAAPSGNAFNIGSGEYDFTYVLAKNADTGVLTVTNAGGSVEPVYPEVTYVIGNVNGLGWDPTNGVALDKVSDGVYSAEVEIGTELGTEYGYFSFASSLSATADDWSSLGQRYGSVADNTVPSLEEPNTIQAGEFSFMVEAPAKYAMTLSLVDKTLVITKVGGGDDPHPSIYVPETLYLMGNVGANAWDVTAGVEMALLDNVFTASQVEVSDAGEGSGYIQFNEFRGTTSTDWDTINSGYRYGAPEADSPIVFAEGESSVELNLTVYVPNVNASACQSFIMPAGTYDFAVNFNGEAPVLTVSKSTNAIDAVAVEGADAPVEYYNLQGVRVAEPANGLYIRRQGNTITKVFVK